MKWRWRVATFLWVLAGVCFLVAPSWAVPISVQGFDLSVGQLALLLGLAVAWGDMRRMVLDIKGRMDRLPCHDHECPEDRSGAKRRER